MGAAFPEILSSYPRSGSPKRSMGGVCRRPHYPYPHYSFRSFYSANGSYLLFAPLGQVHVSALDLSRFDRGEASATLAYAESVLVLDPVIRATVPSVVALTPDNGATGVDPATRISITFSEPVERSSITAASIVLSSSDNTPVAGVFSFSPDATTVSFYPEVRLVSEGRYTIAIATSVRDLQGYGLAEPLSASFIVRDTTPPPMPPAGSISATFPDEEGMITVTASQGSAEYDATVLIINDTSGEIVSIAPFSDGSFSARIHGQLGDEIQVVLMDNAGNQTLISYLTFTAADGRTLVTAKGGKVVGEGGLLLELPAGALVGPAVVKITPVTESELSHPVPAGGQYLAAIQIDTGEINFRKEVHLSIPLPEGFDPQTPVFLTRPGSVQLADGSVEQVYEVIDSTKVINGRITTASPPFDGVMAFGIFTFIAFPVVEPVIVSGFTYREMNDLPGYQSPPDGLGEVSDNNYDQPVVGAVIRSPWAWNYVSYSNARGGYATFSSLVANVGMPCKEYVVTAVNPYTMLRQENRGQLCASVNNVERFNFKLGDKGSVPPDTTPPAVEATLKIAPGQDAALRIVSGTVPPGTRLLCPVRVFDEGLTEAYMTIKFRGDDGSRNDLSVVLDRPADPVTSGTIQRGVPVPLLRYDYFPRFDSFSAQSSFIATAPGVYTFVIEAIDKGRLSTIVTRQIRVNPSGAALPTGREGAPVVDRIEPEDDSSDHAVAGPVTIWFSEPVENVTSATVKLLDMTAAVNGVIVPSTVTVRLEGNRSVAVLTPKSVLWYGHSYRVVVTQGIIDANENTTAPPEGNGRFPLDREYVANFQTTQPLAYDLDLQQQFTGGRDVALYEYSADDGTRRGFAYVAAGDAGWRVIDVTDPAAPVVVQTRNLTNAGVTWNIRGLSVDQESGRLAVTEDIRWADGEQFGYVRFYDLTATPENPVAIGREKLAEAYSGIPGRLALSESHAYVATVAVGLQVVDADAAVAKGVAASDGKTIVGLYDTVANGFSSPNDVTLYGGNKALVTTNSGQLLVLDISTPYYPLKMVDYKPIGYSFTRVTGLPAYTYTDANGNDITVDLAIAGTREGRLLVIDLSNPYAPTILGIASNEDGTPASVMAFDIAVVREEAVAYVTTLNAIVVLDLRDPSRPTLRNRYDTLPTATGGSTDPLTQTPAIATLGGWLFMANQTNGLRTLGVNPYDLDVFNEENEVVAEIGYSFGKEIDRRYQIVVNFDDPNLTCSDDDLVGSVVVRTRAGGDVTAPAGIDLPSRYPLTFRKGSDGRCLGDLKRINTPSGRFIVANFPAGELNLTTDAGEKLVPIFGGIGTKATFEFSSLSDGRLLKRKSISLEKLIRVAFDGNRDGKVKFNDPDDQTYTFWLNDDNDVNSLVFDHYGEPMIEEDDFEVTRKPSGFAPDSDDGEIKILRDLEDFAPLQIQIDEHAQRVIQALSAQGDAAAPTFSVHLQFKNTHGTTPEINLFEAVASAYEYQQTEKDSVFQLTKKIIATIGTASSKELTLNTVAEDGKSVYIFEGKTAGSGDLTVVLKSGGVVVEETKAVLDLKPITWFYDRFEVNYDESSERVAQTIDSGASLKSGYHPKSNDYVLYVHGWNMTADEKSRWTETIFKRLWWQGYTGHVGIFSWPTYDTHFEVSSGTTFDRSELRAWQSAESLRDLLENRMDDYRGEIRLLGHSMGGIVSGEAIKKLSSSGIVKSYIATQAALSAHFYDSSVNERSWRLPQFPATPNVFGYYHSGEEETTEQPYLSATLEKVESAFNYFNVDDYALTDGAGSVAGWEMNVRSRPDPGYIYCGDAFSCVTGLGPLVDSQVSAFSLLTLSGQKVYLRVGLSNDGLDAPKQLKFDDDRYEIFSRIIQSRVKALGATSKHLSEFSGYKNLKKDCGYNSEHYSHSKEFRSNIVDEMPYWTSVMSNFSLERTTRRK